MKPSEQAFWTAYQAGQHTIDDVVQRYVGYVQSTAYKLARRTHFAFYEDLAQEGLIAVVDAAASFDPTMGAGFLSFAARRIYGAMLDFLRKNDHVPRGERQREKAGLVTTRRMTSLQERVYEQDARDVSLQDILLDKRLPLLQWEDYEAFDHLLRGLSETEQTILVMTFWDEATQYEVAEVVGLSPSRISQKIQQLLEFMKKREEARHGRDGPAVNGPAGRETDFSRPDGADPRLVA